MDFDKAKASALKILGKDAEFPKLPGDLAKDQAAFVKANNESIGARNEFEKKILVAKQAIDKWIDTAEAYNDVFEGSDYGLNPKDKGQKKQIDDATKVLTEAINGDLKEKQSMKTVLEQIFKQIASIKKSLDAAAG